MKKITKPLIFVFFIMFLSSCNEEELTGNARLEFSGNNIEDLEIDIYPESIFTVSELIDAQPLIRNIQAVNGEVVVPNFNPGNYTWYDSGNNIGFFQITAGQTRTFEFFIR